MNAVVLPVLPPLLAALALLVLRRAELCWPWPE